MGGGREGTVATAHGLSSVGGNRERSLVNNAWSRIKKKGQVRLGYSAKCMLFDRTSLGSTGQPLPDGWPLAVWRVSKAAAPIQDWIRCGGRRP